MNHKEFERWFSFHQTMIPSVATWVSNNPDIDTLLGTWAHSMRDVEFEDAKAATLAIVNGDIERPFPESTIGVVRKAALGYAMGRRQSEPEPAYDDRVCGLCRGSGHVSIWHPMVVRAVRHGIKSLQEPSGAIRTLLDGSGDVKRLKAAVACKCSLGDRYAKWMRKEGERWVAHPMPRFGDSTNHVREVFRTWDELKGKTVRERIQADIDEAPSQAVEWEFDNVPDAKWNYKTADF
jgi:hypothetical protein